MQTDFELAGLSVQSGKRARNALPMGKALQQDLRSAMSLDSITLYFVATMVAALLGAMLLFFGNQENNSPLRWWGTAYLLGAASVALWTLAADKLGDVLAFALNGVGFVACGMVWNASRVFHGRKPNLPGLLLG